MTRRIEKQPFLIPGYNDGKVRERLQNLAGRIISPLADRAYISLKYWIILGRWPNLDTPQRFTEKIQVRKLYDRNPAYCPLIDKIEAKEHVARLIGSEFIIPTYWSGKDLSAVDWDQIPRPCIVKPSHTSGQGHTIYDEDDIDRLLASRDPDIWKQINHFNYNREWAYADLEPNILIEEMLQSNNGLPADYRFYVFDGNVHLVEMTHRDNGRGYSTLFDPNWNRLDIRDPLFLEPYPGELDRPNRVCDMLEIASTLGANHDFVRVDLYAEEDWIKFGELTFYPSGGYEAFEPDHTDIWLGEFWDQRLFKD